MGLLGIFSIISACFQCIKEVCEPVIPAENWANKELIEKDRSCGMSQDQIMWNVKNGRYIVRIQYPTPHRDSSSGKIIIENDELYRADVSQFGAYQAYRWVEQGKYNLNAAELEIAHLKIERSLQHLYSLTNPDSCYVERIKEIDAILATKKWNYRDTEAVRQWQRAHDANIGCR